MTKLLPPPPSVQPPVRAPAAPVRFDRVARLRREIALGRYPSARMLSIALERLIDDATGRDVAGRSAVHAHVS